ncbi:MAG: hypothetical protein V5B31_04785 [Candidatus Accumulibacter propinquus]|uniref:hypothetical protein n=1 Tax=Candidatus Accumulibacter propinquus TaxID=2954380 RepID=UPI002FC2D735
MQRRQPRSLEAVLAAAGQIFAVLLFADKTGLALDPERANERFPDLAACLPPDLDAAYRAVGSRLFRPEGLVGEERLLPTHRSIAEYLAARWLAVRIDRQGLPLGRVLNLLVGSDGRAVAGLRGLYGWLALHCRSSRARLIEVDPLTVVTYGDVKPMSVEDKRRILSAWRREAIAYPAFHLHATDRYPLGAMSDPGLRDAFLEILQSSERDDASQSTTDSVLEMLTQGVSDPELAPVLLEVVRDDTRWPRVRHSALVAWLKLAPASAALALLDDIGSDRVRDPDDEIAGILLRQLYPTHLAPKDLLRYLRTPRNSRLLGVYFYFWRRVLPRIAPDEHLPILLDAFVDRIELGLYDRYGRRLSEIADALLARALTVCGDEIEDERLFLWLGVGANRCGTFTREKAAQETIAAWLGARPRRYEAMLALCYEHSANDANVLSGVYRRQKRLCNAPCPDDLGRWHLVRVWSSNNDELARTHLREAVNCLIQLRGVNGLSLEAIEAWSMANPDKQHWLGPLLVEDLSDWRRQIAIEAREENQQKADRTEATRALLPMIQQGTAPVDLLHELAGVWGDRHTDSQEEAPVGRFATYCDNAGELLAAVEAGFRRCLERTDLPSIDEIIELCFDGREHFIRRPCLVGMELLWRENPAEVDRLPDDTLRRMIAFRLTDGTDDTPEWFLYLVQQQPSLVAAVLLAYASRTLKAGKAYVDGIFALAHEPQYQLVARLAVPPLLAEFPVPAPAEQLQYLAHLLKAALQYLPDCLPPLLTQKTASKDMDVEQKVYWFATGMLLDAGSWEDALWDYITRSDTCVGHLSRLLSHRFGELDDRYDLSALTTGRLIEHLAPHAELDRTTTSGVVTDAMDRGDHVRALITRLGASATPEAAQEIDRLLDLAVLKELRPLLQRTRHELKQRQRERDFRFPLPCAVAQILANDAPTSVADLAALALDLLDGIAKDIRCDNDDGFRAFWSEGRPENRPKPENSCRDALLTRLRARLSPLAVDCQPESDRASDKRADLLLSYRAQFELPIEIKRDSNPSLWTAPCDQLARQYSVAPRSAGYGIYLVFWFGGEKVPPHVKGGEKPRSPEELRNRLEEKLAPSERQRLFVRVLDVSWPA